MLGKSWRCVWNLVTFSPIGEILGPVLWSQISWTSTSSEACAAAWGGQSQQECLSHALGCWSWWRSVYSATILPLDVILIDQGSMPHLQCDLQSGRSSIREQNSATTTERPSFGILLPSKNGNDSRSPTSICRRVRDLWRRGRGPLRENQDVRYVQGNQVRIMLIFVQSQGKRERCTKEEADSRRYGWTRIQQIRANSMDQNRKSSRARRSRSQMLHKGKDLYMNYYTSVEIPAFGRGIGVQRA